METLNLEGTANTPKVILDKANGTFEISGRSLSDTAREFYAQVVDWIGKYSVVANETTEFVFRFDYVNNESSKAILDILFALQKVKGARVVWYFPEDDEDMEETGEELAELVKIPFELKAF